MQYDTIKQLAKERGIRVTDLIALAPANDPFYTGRPAELEAAGWFADLWQGFGYTSGVHLRRIHYRMVSQEPLITTPYGKPYENTESCWGYLNNASKYARYLDLVDPAAFVDRRNPEAIINDRPDSYQDPTPAYALGGDPDKPFPDWGYELPDLPELPDLDYRLPYMPDFDVYGYEDIRQGYLVEVWAEKSTMNDVLIPLCREYGVNLITGLGELSITAVIHFLDRARRAERPARILYVSDYDPAGLGMPISIARKVEFYQRSEGFDDLDIRLEPVILTADQASSYNLPRTPIKDSDLRKETWEAARGEGATELDALEALHPGEMKRIVEQTILNYYDPTLPTRARQERRALSEALGELRADALDGYRGTLGALESDYSQLLEEFEATRARFAELIADFQPEIDAHETRLDDIKKRFAEVYSTAYADLEAIDLDAEEEYPLPEPDLPEENEALLYASDRDYLSQLDYYKAYRNGGEA